VNRLFGAIVLLLACSLQLPPVSATEAQGPLPLLSQLSTYPHARQVSREQRDVIDYEIGLGAMQKVRGSWRFKHSERHSGRLIAYTWQIVDGFSSAEVLEELSRKVSGLEGATELFACDGRACGRGVEWANRVFGQRVLYGREDQQRYRVYALAQEAQYRLLVYSALRTADRQYLHVELLEILSEVE